MRNPKRYQNKANPEGAIILRPEGINDPSDKQAPPAPTMPPLTMSGLISALGVTDREVEMFKPTPDVLAVGQAFLAGHNAIGAIKAYTGLDSERVRAVLDSAISMQWISRRVEALFRSRSAVVDCALYLRAAAGDLKAMDLFYRRMRLLEETTKKVDIHYSGSVNLSALSDADLSRLVREKAKSLPTEFRVINASPTNDGAREGKKERSGEKLGAQESREDQRNSTPALSQMPGDVPCQGPSAVREESREERGGEPGKGA